MTWTRKSSATIDEVLDHRPLTGCGLAGPHHGFDFRLAAFPPQVVEPAEGEEHQGQPAQQHDHAQRAPQDGVTGQQVADGGVVGKIVGVRIGLVRPVGHAGPGGPGEKGGQLADLFRVVDILARKPAVVGRMHEVIGPHTQLPFKRGFFGRGKRRVCGSAS